MRLGRRYEFPAKRTASFGCCKGLVEQTLEPVRTGCKGLVYLTLRNAGV